MSRTTTLRSSWKATRLPTNVALTNLRCDHVALRVRDYDAAVQWYVNKLDFRVVKRWRSRGMRLAYITNGRTTLEIMGGGNPRLMRRAKTLAESLKRAGYHHFCLQVDGLENVLAELRRRGVRIVRKRFKVKAIRRWLAFVQDNSGTMIELSQRL